LSQEHSKVLVEVKIGSSREEILVDYPQFFDSYKIARAVVQISRLPEVNTALENRDEGSDIRVVSQGNEILGITVYSSKDKPIVA
jgi:hypothetical protein